jgi:hypothetical protein
VPSIDGKPEVGYTQAQEPSSVSAGQRSIRDQRVRYAVLSDRDEAIELLTGIRDALAREADEAEDDAVRWRLTQLIVDVLDTIADFEG